MHFLIFNTLTNKRTQKNTKYKSQNTIHGNVNSYIFRYRIVIFRESTKSKKWRVGLVFLCFIRLPEDGSPVPKHVGDEIYHELYLVIGIPLDFKE
jgi:hypothetical protein